MLWHAFFNLKCVGTPANPAAKWKSLFHSDQQQSFADRHHARNREGVCKWPPSYLHSWIGAGWEGKPSSSQCGEGWAKDMQQEIWGYKAGDSHPRFEGGGSGKFCQRPMGQLRRTFTSLSGEERKIAGGWTWWESWNYSGLCGSTDLGANPNSTTKQNLIPALSLLRNEGPGSSSNMNS